MNERDKSKRHNVVLIGMPGAGKSTVGVVLAKRLGYAFMDSDLVIQNKEGRLLHEIIAEKGVEGFWQTEEEINASIETDYTVIATGGSVIYGSRAMEHFKQIGIIVYLKLSLEAITERLGDLNERGVTLREGQDLAALYAERIPMYERYADITMDCEGLSIREIVAAIAEQIVN
ncbi:MAG: shikimate kinase [Lachnospiraceae bacterium]|nr:shikimate kinase [Lachnospiraceae bacterium]